MTPTQISKRGLQTLIMRAPDRVNGLSSGGWISALETPDAFAAAMAPDSVRLPGRPKDCCRAHTIDIPQQYALGRNVLSHA